MEEVRIEDYDKIKAKRDKILKEKEEKFKNDSRNRLRKISSTKIRTTMIFALEVIERYFGPLWQEDLPNSEQFKEKFEQARKEILDKGNDQIRNLEIEFDQYNVEWLRFRYQLPVKKD